MISITITGTGNVASHLYKAFKVSPQVEVLQVQGREKPGFCTEDEFAFLGSDTIPDAEVHLLAVSDRAIATVAQVFTGKTGLVAHTSGNTALDALPKDLRRGVFYPLQSFTTGRELDFTTIPICIEADRANDLNLLKRLASVISGEVVSMDTQHRQELHLAAVFVSNFTNHLYYLGERLCIQNGVSPKLLLPLIQETAAKVAHISPMEAQTGPARRNDKATLEIQSRSLGKGTIKEIYDLISRSIIETYEPKL